MTRVTIAEYGPKRGKVRVFVEGELVRVIWRVAGKLKTQSFANNVDGKKTAKAFAKGVADAKLSPVTKAPLTLRDLWNRFAAAEFLTLRAKSTRNYTHYFAKWIAMWGGDFEVERTTLAMVPEFRVELAKKHKLATNTVRQAIQAVKRVYAWAERNELIERNRVALYVFKVSKDERTDAPHEFTADESGKILGALDPTSATQWRAFVALTICANQGARQNAVLHLKWADVDEKRDVITWRSEFDKMGREWTQPSRPATRAALDVAFNWRNAMGYEGPWILPAGSSKNRSEVYTIQSLWSALKGAQRRTGVANLSRRGGHAFRRTLVGDVNEVTGDPALALLSVGDTDIRQAKSYLKKRDTRIKAAFERLDNPDRERKV